MLGKPGPRRHSLAVGGGAGGCRREDLVPAIRMPHGRRKHEPPTRVEKATVIFPKGKPTVVADKCRAGVVCSNNVMR